jgi:hypothetical protein
VNSKLPIYSLLLIGSIALAGKKVVKTELCADLNRSYQVCIAKSADGKRTYVVKSGFGARDTGPQYSLAGSDKTEARVGSTSRTVQATKVEWDKDKLEATEQNFKVSISRVVVPNAEWKGVVQIDNGEPSPELTFREP